MLKATFNRIQRLALLMCNPAGVSRHHDGRLEAFATSTTASTRSKTQAFGVAIPSMVVIAVVTYLFRRDTQKSCSQNGIIASLGLYPVSEGTAGISWWGIRGLPPRVGRNLQRAYIISLGLS